jgi:sugar/nucleoside kinase (ribokinase family)
VPQVDFSACVDDAFLEELGVEKGTRKLISHEERGAVLSRLDGESYKCNAGGSLSNTLVALSRLGAGAASPLRVGLAAAVGSDALGDFYQAKMSKAGVGVASTPLEGGTTGTVIVLTTPDAQRTFLSFLGDSARLPQLGAEVAGSQLLLVEGYLLEQAETADAIAAVVREARAAGVLVALTCADVGVVRSCKAAFHTVLAAGVDVLFANAAEATELVGEVEASDAAVALARTAGLAVVTDGSRGAYLATKSVRLHAPPHWTDTAPVDTCGAGDAYAAGVLHSLLNQASLACAGAFGARVARAVISRNGARLRDEDAAMLSCTVFPGLAAANVM